MAITTLQQSTEVSGVGVLTLSETVHDDVNSVWVRELKAFGPEEGGVRPLLLYCWSAYIKTLNLNTRCSAYNEKTKGRNG